MSVNIGVGVGVNQGFFSDFFCRGKKIANAAAPALRPAADFFYPRKINSQLSALQLQFTMHYMHDET